MPLTHRIAPPPTPAGAAIVDQHGAALLAMGILAALFHRERTGEGQELWTSLMDGGAVFASDTLLLPDEGGRSTVAEFSDWTTDRTTDRAADGLAAVRLHRRRTPAQRR